MVLPCLEDVDALPYLEIAGLRYKSFFFIFANGFLAFIYCHISGNCIFLFFVCLFAELFKI